MSNQYPQFVNDFLNSLLASIKDTKSRNDVSDEILGHLEDAWEQNSKLGMTREQSFRKTLEILGDPKKLGAGLKKARQAWYLRWVYIVPSIMAFSCLTACVATTLYASSQFDELLGSFQKDPDIRSQIINGHKELKEADAFFSKIFISGKDAGVILNQLHLPVIAIRQEEDTSKLPNNREYYRRLPMSGLKLTSDEWMELADEKVEYRADFSWMKTLEQYSYWDLYLSNGKNPDNTYSQTHSIEQIPNLNIFVRWARLRLVSGIISKDPLPALKEVRKLAELIYSTETIYGTGVAIEILANMNRAILESRNRQLLKVADWPLINFDLYKKARVLAWSVNHWTDFFASNEYKSEIFQLQPIFGSCAAINEAAIGAANLGSLPLTKDPLLFERGFEQQTQDFRKFVSEQGKYCRLTYAKYILDHPAPLQIPKAIGESSFDLTYLTYQIPYLRQYTVARELSIRPNWLMAYDNYIHLKK
jgi:hypothetical protein